MGDTSTAGRSARIVNETADRLLQFAEQNAQGATNILHDLNNRTFIVPKEEIERALELARAAEHQLQGILYMIERGR